MLSQPDGSPTSRDTNNHFQDVFEASVAAYRVAGFNYDAHKSVERMTSAITERWAM